VSPFRVFFSLSPSFLVDNLKTTKKTIGIVRFNFPQSSTTTTTNKPFVIVSSPLNSNSFLLMLLFFINDRNLSPDLLDLGRPAFDTLTLAADRDVDLALALHSPCAFKERVAGHAAGVGALGGHELEHGEKEVADAAGLLHAKVVFLTQHIGQSPVAQAVDIAELAFAVEYFL